MGSVTIFTDLGPKTGRFRHAISTYRQHPCQSPRLRLIPRPCDDTRGWRWHHAAFRCHLRPLSGHQTGRRWQVNAWGDHPGPTGHTKEGREQSKLARMPATRRRCCRERSDRVPLEGGERHGDLRRQPPTTARYGVWSPSDPYRPSLGGLIAICRVAGHRQACRQGSGLRSHGSIWSIPSMNGEGNRHRGRPLYAADSMLTMAE